MYNKPLIILVFSFWMAVMPNAVYSAPDQYPGDTCIYGGAAAQIQPNVLIVLDTTGSMSETVLASSTEYDPNTEYPSLKECYNDSVWLWCSKDSVYLSSGYYHLADVNSVTTSCNGYDPKTLLKTTGQYSGRKIKTDGSCRSSGTASYVTGNYLNWLNGPATVYKQKIVIAKEVIANLLNSTTGVNFGVMRFDETNKAGFFTTTVSGNTYSTTIKPMGDTDFFTGTTTNKQALIQAVNSLTVGGATNVGEAMFEGMRYFSAGNSIFSKTIGTTGSPNYTYTSPIQASCQKNYMIVITDGETNSDNSAVLKTICNQGDCDGDGQEPGNLNHVMDDVAKYMYENDMSSAYAGLQNITTFTIGFGDVGSNPTAVALLERTANSTHGRGQAFLASDQAGLATSLMRVVSNILEINSSFVAPVVPVSPENKTTSANRIYIGLFKPENGSAWLGNLKKYGMSSDNYVTDSLGNRATYIDAINNTSKAPVPDGVDDVDGSNLDLGAVDGSFRLTSRSFWSSTADAGNVDSGGVGEKLVQRATARNIYTYLGTNTALTHASNAFTTSNASILYSTLDVADDAAKNSLINYLHGQDAYDEDSDGNLTEKRSWILGDILHSKPLVVHYASFDVETEESNCTKNKSVIYVGANDGMLHAFNDCDGSEAWAFVPPQNLPNLKHVNSSSHTTYMDATPYILNLSSRKILLVGQRRGGGTSSNPTGGFYYALDVTTPGAPVYMWSISNLNASFTELAETWSEPKIVKVKTQSGNKYAAVIGAGYDNLSEDARYGKTQNYAVTGTVTVADTGSGAVTSTGTSASPANPKGRGVYLVELATEAGDITQSGTKIWGYTYASNTAMTFSFPAEIAATDRNSDGYVDRLYAVDAGANLWMFDLSAANTTLWTGRKVFAANPGSGGATDIGRKAFYKPSATMQIGYDYVFFGTGDREHPLNTNVTDRIYAVKVKNSETAITPVKTESSLVDVTTNDLQAETPVNTAAYNLAQLQEKAGWYIKLNQSAGEKVLASPVLFNKELYMTTYMPEGAAVVDPCQPSNLGASNLYILNYLTGEATTDLSAANNSTTNSSNTRAQGGATTTGGVTTYTKVNRDDRKVNVGQGIASAPVVVISSTGKVDIKTSVSGNLGGRRAKSGGVVLPLLWRQR